MVALAMIGVPSNSAGTGDGVALAPDALRAQGLITALSRYAEVIDLGNVMPTPSRNQPPARDRGTMIIDPDGLAATIAATRASVETALAADLFPIVVGGDCPLLIGCLAAVAGEGTGTRPGLLFVDGHEDAYPPEQSPTGEAADMELGFLLGRNGPPPGIEAPTLLPSDVVILGARDARLLREEGVRSLRTSVPFVDDAELATDPEGMTRRALATIPRPWWFHLDLDVLSTEALPSVDYQQAGGIGWTDLTTVAREAVAAEPSGMDITIYNPDMDADGEDARRIVEFLGGVARMIAET